MALVRSRSRHQADLDQAHAPRERTGAYLAGVRHELGQLERPGPGALARLTLTTIAVGGAVTAYLAGCDRLVAELVAALF